MTGDPVEEDNDARITKTEVEIVALSWTILSTRTPRAAPMRNVSRKMTTDEEQ
jgi:hypothetical protein